MAEQGRKNLSSMDLVAVLTRVVKEQEKRLADQDERMASQDERIRRLEAMLSAR